MTSIPLNSVENDPEQTFAASDLASDTGQSRHWCGGVLLAAAINAIKRKRDP
jgi:hypothetical protein